MSTTTTASDGSRLPEPAPSLLVDSATPKVIQDRIARRNPNPDWYLSSKPYAEKRFGERGIRKDEAPAPWHKIDRKANKNGRRHLIVLDDGTEYTGDWTANLRHGVGAHCTAVGVYEGDFVDDLYEGNGRYYLWSDTTNCDMKGRWLLYEGEWLTGKYWGAGRKYDENGNRYEGSFVRGKRCGTGTMFYANKDTFTGGWDNDMRNGEGELHRANGDVFRGVFRDDKRDGRGVLHILATKRRLEGIWANDLFKCGSYYDEQENPVYVQPTDISGTTDGMIPILELENPDEVLAEAEARE